VKLQLEKGREKWRRGEDNREIKYKGKRKYLNI